MKNYITAFCFILSFPGVLMATEESKFELVKKTEIYEIRSYKPIIIAEMKIEAGFEDAANRAFKVLADYIFGNNKSPTKTKIDMTAPVTQVKSEKIDMTAPVTQVKSEKIDMTAPVTQVKSEKIDMTAPVTQVKSEKIDMSAPVGMKKEQAGFLVQFTMPAKFNMQTLPKPNDSRIAIREIPARKIAVLRYSGSWSESLYQEKLSELKSALQKDQVKTQGEAVFARYNPPFWPIWPFLFLRRNEIWLELAP